MKLNELNVEYKQMEYQKERKEERKLKGDKKWKVKMNLK